MLAEVDQVVGGGGQPERGAPAKRVPKARRGVGLNAPPDGQRGLLAIRHGARVSLLRSRSPTASVNRAQSGSGATEKQGLGRSVGTEREAPWASSSASTVIIPATASRGETATDSPAAEANTVIVRTASHAGFVSALLPRPRQSAGRLSSC